MSINESMEMYLETIYVLEKYSGHAHVVDIAERLGSQNPVLQKAANYLSDQGM